MDHGVGAFGVSELCKDGTDCSVVAAFGGVAGGTACTDEGVTGGGEVGGANKARGKPTVYSVRCQTLVHCNRQPVATSLCHRFCPPEVINGSTEG